jgi:hypothetical protein
MIYSYIHGPFGVMNEHNAVHKMHIINKINQSIPSIRSHSNAVHSMEFQRVQRFQKDPDLD